MDIKRLHQNNNFNLLRLVLALLVMLAHAAELQDGSRKRELLTQMFGTLSFGELAVNGFFLLSGYLIMQSWDKAPQPVQFLKKRLLRIYPGFIVASLVSLLVVPLLATDVTRYFNELSPAASALGMVILRAPVGPPVFTELHYPQINGALWTIKYEFACYLAVLLVGIVCGIRTRRVWLMLTLAFIAAYLYKSLALPVPWVPLAKLLADHFTRLTMHFLVGGCFYLFRNHYRFRPATALVCAAALFIGMYSPVFANLAVAIFGGYLLFYFAFTPIPFLAGFNSLPDVSYGTYLYGWPVQSLLLVLLPPQSPWVMFALGVLIVIPLGAASWYLVEQPMLKLKQSSRTLRPDALSS